MSDIEVEKTVHSEIPLLTRNTIPSSDVSARTPLGSESGSLTGLTLELDNIFSGRGGHPTPEPKSNSACSCFFPCELYVQLRGFSCVCFFCLWQL